jgi:MHS family alpha-ketoglutarate permease-like MFS transporter
MLRNKHLKSIFGGSIGNLIEWYDWYAYSVFALYFAGSFFPDGNQTAQLLNTAGIFAIGFLMRPIGGWIMGAYADRKGRKAGLTLSVLMMSAGSLMIALVPTYHSIGIMAPVILVLARILQGISIGGEYGAAATYLSEIAPKGKRGLYSSFQYVSTTMGQLLALLILLIMQRWLLDEQQLTSWGWRIPFAIGAVLAVSALYLRKNLSETEQFTSQELSDSKKGTMAELKKYGRQSLLVIGFTLGLTISYYTFTTYIQKFLVNTAGFSKRDSTLITLVTLCLFMAAQPLFGWLGDRFGRKPMMVWFGVVGTVSFYPLMKRLEIATTAWEATVFIAAALLILSISTSISAIVKAELFPANVRSLGVSFPYALTVAVFGGTAEYIALWFKNAGNPEGFYYYLTGCMIITLVSSLFIPADRKRLHL